MVRCVSWRVVFVRFSRAFDPTTKRDAQARRWHAVKAAAFERTPGGIGPKLGSHNDEVYSELLGMVADELASLGKDGVI